MLREEARRRLERKKIILHQERRPSRLAARRSHCSHPPRSASCYVWQRALASWPSQGGRSRGPRHPDSEVPCPTQAAASPHSPSLRSRRCLPLSHSPSPFIILPFIVLYSPRRLRWPCVLLTSRPGLRSPRQTLLTPPSARPPPDLYGVAPSQLLVHPVADLQLTP